MQAALHIHLDNLDKSLSNWLAGSILSAIDRQTHKKIDNQLDESRLLLCLEAVGLPSVSYIANRMVAHYTSTRNNSLGEVEN